VEFGSEHPLALAVVEKAKKENVLISKASDFEAWSGRGIRAVLNGSHYLAGNSAFMQESGLFSGDETSRQTRGQAWKLSSEGKTPLLFAKDGVLVGVIAVADTIRESSRTAIRQFHDLGLHVVILTGDNKITAEAIRKELNIEEAISDVLPTEKESCVRALQEKDHKAAMVGDGINDAPALTRADIGIAIGAGTDIAIESADVVLMKNSLNDVVTAINLSKAVLKNIKMNLFWAFFYNILGIPIAAGAFYPAFGLRLSPMIGAAAMSLSSLFVVTNALRLRFFKEKEADDSNSNATISALSAVMGKNENNSGNKPLNMEGEITMKKIITVEGMMCAHCQMHVQKALAAVDGVIDASVDLESKKATVSLSKDVEDKVLFNAITEAGYTPVHCVTEDKKSVVK